MTESTAIFWPVFVQVFATLGLYVAMSRTRVAAVKAGEMNARDFRYNENETEIVRNQNRALANQFESPVLFYAGCIIAHVTGVVNPVLVALAWGYALAKLAHMVVHARLNRLRYRRPLFILAFGTLVVFWACLAMFVALK